MSYTELSKKYDREQDAYLAARDAYRTAKNKTGKTATRKESLKKLVDKKVKRLHKLDKQLDVYRRNPKKLYE